MLKFQWQIFYFRIVALNKTLRIIFLLALILVIATLFQNAGPSLFKWTEIANRIGLAYITSMLFYFIVVHCPKEKKKQAIYQNINNASFEIQSLIAGYYYAILEKKHQSGGPIDLSHLAEFHRRCKTLPLMNPIQGRFDMYYGTFNSHFECYRFMSVNIERNYAEIIHFYDLLSAEYLYALNKIHQSFRRPPFNGTRTGNEFVDSLAIGMEANCEDANTLQEGARKFKKKMHEEYTIPFKIRSLRERLK